MKCEVDGKGFGSDDVKNYVESWLSSLGGSFYEDGMEKLSPVMTSVGGNYVKTCKNKIGLNKNCTIFFITVGPTYFPNTQVYLK